MNYLIPLKSHQNSFSGGLLAIFSAAFTVASKKLPCGNLKYVYGFQCSLHNCLRKENVSPFETLFNKIYELSSKIFSQLNPIFPMRKFLYGLEFFFHGRSMANKVLFWVTSVTASEAPKNTKKLRNAQWKERKENTD